MGRCSTYLESPNERISRQAATNAQDAADGHQVRFARSPVQVRVTVHKTPFGIRLELLESRPSVNLFCLFTKLQYYEHTSPAKIWFRL